MYKIRIVLDTQEDVIRTLLVNDTITLEELHFAIVDAFGFNDKEMASFYLTDDNWSQGEEIPLFNMSDNPATPAMGTCILNEVLPNISDKLIYVYDFLKMWVFYVEIIDILPAKSTDAPKTILAVGEIPKEKPLKEFNTESYEESIDDDISDEFGELRGFDLDNY
ncbi:MAG: hypothetical protein GKR88_13550 [Flavobacteriaceae bacterium]|nr:MAG: hypothetical protein GKR88_13550 [Flavobacteriaceae bacterium]